MLPSPTLRSVLDASPRVRALLPALPEHVEAFVVVHEGAFGGREHAAGDILICRGAVDDGDTVLVALGHGRPRLGSVIDGRLVGDAGEPCHPARWRAAGQLVASYRQGAHGWVVHLLGGAFDDAVAAPQEAAEASPVPAAVQGAQLSLFAA